MSKKCICPNCQAELDGEEDLETCHLGWCSEDCCINCIDAHHREEHDQ